MSIELNADLALLHRRAQSAAMAFRRAEGELMEALIAVDRAKVYARLGYASLFQYAVSDLGLSEAVAYAAISVARKAESVPALREAVAAGAIGLSKARKVVAVLDPAQPSEVQSRWVEKAVSLSSRKLERAVAHASPRASVSERAVYKSETRIELTLGVSEAIMLDFRAAQDLVSSAKGQAATLEETLARVLELYLSRKDPEQRARRILAKKGLRGVRHTSISTGPGRTSGKSRVTPVTNVRTLLSDGLIPAATNPAPTHLSTDAIAGANDPTTVTNDSILLAKASRVGTADAPSSTSEAKWNSAASVARKGDASTKSSDPRVRSLLFTGTVPFRKPIPAAILHGVRLRDRNSCQARLPDGKICRSKRWLEIHHRRPVSEGGTNELDNLITYCRAHHSLHHERMRGQVG